MKMQVGSPASISELMIHCCLDAWSCGVDRRHGSDLAWLWLWHWLAATAPIQPLSWKPLYAMGLALKKIKLQHWKLENNDNTFKIMKEMFSTSGFYIQPNYKSKVKADQYICRNLELKKKITLDTFAGNF